MAVFSNLLTVNHTGTNNIVFNEVTGVFATEKAAKEQILTMAGGEEIENEINLYQWIYKDGGEYYTARAFIQEHSLGV